MSKAISRAEAEKCAADDPILRHMIDRGSPLTREAYIGTAWMDEPQEWTVEHEMSLPACFRDHNALPAMQLHKHD